MALAEKLIRGSAVNLAEQGVKLAIVFVTTPLMVRYLGRDDYGLWIVSLAIIGYFRLLDLGISLSGNRFLSKAIGSGGNGRFHELFLTLSYFYNRIGLATFILTLILSFLVPLWLPRDSVISSSRWIILGLGLATATRYWTKIFEVVLKSHLRYDMIGFASILKALFQGGLVTYFLINGHGLHTLLFIFIATDVIDQALLFAFSRRIYPEGRLRVVRKPPSDVKPLLHYSATAMATRVAGNLRNGIDPLIVGHISGLAIVPIYSIGNRFLSIFTDIINAVFGGNFLAAFSQLDGRNDQSSLVRNFMKSVRFSSALAAIGGTFLIIFGPSFIDRWIGPSFADSGLILQILTIPTVLMLMQYPVGGFIYSQNKQLSLAVMTLGGGLFNLIVSIILALHVGFFGVVWGTFLELLILYGVILPYLAARTANLSVASYFLVLVKSVFPFAILGCAYFLATSKLILPDYLRLAVLGAGLALLSLPLIWIFTFSVEDRQHLKTFLRRP